MAATPSLAEPPAVSPKLTVTPSTPLASAVAIPTRNPPTAVAKNTAGKYGVKNTSGRISERPHRAAVESARQQAAKPAPKGGEGCAGPCQPRRNSSINFAMGPVSRSAIQTNTTSNAAGIACVASSSREYSATNIAQNEENDMGRLDGKVAVITGATSGIGLRTAEVFVAEGARIVIAGRRAPEGEALAKKLGANCIFLKTDVTVEDQMRALIGQAVTKFGRIDCLFNNAGGPAQIGGIEGLEVDRFDAAIATLLRSVMLGMKHAAPHMKKQGSGSIINNGSIAGQRTGYSSSMVYSAAKAAVIHLTRCVAMELGESGVRVNSISPGLIATGIFGKALGLSIEAAERTPDTMRAVSKNAQPIPRAGLPEDIARAAVFLASDESSFINGHDLVVDGAITGGRNWTAQQQGYVAMRKAFDQHTG